jgi:predicted transcriptional regulator
MGVEITVRQAAAKLGVNPSRVRQMILAGKIKARHLTPRMLLIDVRELAKVGNATSRAGQQRQKDGDL